MVKQFHQEYSPLMLEQRKGQIIRRQSLQLKQRKLKSQSQFAEKPQTHSQTTLDNETNFITKSRESLLLMITHNKLFKEKTTSELYSDSSRKLEEQHLKFTNRVSLKIAAFKQGSR